MSRRPNWVDLRRTRDLGALLSDGFGTYFRNFGTFVALAAVVVVPVQVILSGIGLRQFTAHYDKTPSVAQVALPAAVTFLVTTPLVTAMTIHAVLELGAARPPSARAAIARGFDVFAPLFLVVLMSGVGVALGFVAFFVPGLFLAVRWYFVPETVVVEGLRGTAALRRSWQLVKGYGWRVFGILILASLAIGGASSVIQQPLMAVARSSGHAYWELIGATIAQCLAVPATAVIATLLYFDLRARKESWSWAQAPEQHPPPGS